MRSPSARRPVAAEDVRVDALFPHRPFEEVARFVAAHLADVSRRRAQPGGGTDRVRGRTSEREGTGQGGGPFGDAVLQIGVDQVHSAPFEVEGVEQIVGF